MSESWNINPASGDYVMERGSPVPTNSLQIPAYIRLRTPREGWMYAPDASYGSDFANLKKRQTTRDSSEVESIAARALQPILDDGRAQSIEVTTTESQRNAIGLKADIIDAQGNVESLDLKGLGV